MSILSRPKIAPQQRFDLEDWNALIGALCGDSKLKTQNFWSANPLIMDGFVTSGIGASSATVTIANSALIAAGGSSNQSWYVAPSTAPAEVVALQAGVKNYLEVSLAYVGDNELLRAFWDAIAAGGVGAEFNQLTETIENLELTIETSTSGFSGDSNKVPIAIVETNGSGVVKTILDQRDLFWRLGQPQDSDRNFAWGTNSEPELVLNLSSIVGTFLVGETITFDGAETAEVVDFTGSVLKVKNLNAATFSPLDALLGLTNGATAVLETAEDSFTGADKDIKNSKDLFDALMTEIKVAKFGLLSGKNWFERSNNSLNGLTQFLNSILTQNVAGAEYSWDGTNFSITDANVSPANADELAGLRLLGNTQDLLLTRQDGTGGSSTLAVADGEVLFLKLPVSGDRTFSGAGVGDTNFQITTKAAFVASDENYWLVYREGDRIYIRGYGEMEPGESAPISDPAKAELEAQINANQAKNNQDRSAKLIEGGTWSLALNGNDLLLSADAYVEVGGLSKVRNTISAQTINMPNADSVAYISILRSAGAADIRTVSVADINSVTLTDDVVIIARKISTGVIVGSSSFVLKPGEFLELDGALAEINRHLGQMRIKPHETNTDQVRVTDSEISLLDGAELNQVINTFLLDFSGSVIDFTTGDVFESDGSTPLGNNFTPFTVPVSQYFWYGVSLVSDTLSGVNEQTAKLQIDPASAANAVAASAPKSVVSGTIKLGLVRVFNNAGTIEIDLVKRFGVGSGSGGGGASIKAEYMNPVSTVLPTGTSYVADGTAVVDGDTVLFSNLLVDNNRVYEVSGVGVALVWTPQRVFNNFLDALDGDSVRIKSGDAFKEQLAVFNGTEFLVNDTVRHFDGVSANFWEVSGIKTSTLTDATTAILIDVSAAGSENMIIDYSISRGTFKETGQMFVTTNGTDASVSRSETYIGDVGVAFSAVINAGDLEVSYSTTSTGADATMKYTVKRWSNSPGGPTGIPNYATSGASSVAAAGSLGEIQFHGSGGTLDADAKLKWEAGDGSLNLNGLKIKSLTGPLTINDNQVAALALFNYPVSAYNFTIVEYSIKRGTDYRVGRLLIPNSGIIVSISDDNVDTGATGVVLSAALNAGNVEVKYTSTPTGQAGQFKYSIRQWSE